MPKLGGSGERVRVEPELSDGVWGGPVQLRGVGKHDASGLRMNLDALDAGTKAHEDTVSLLRKRLAEMGIVAQRPSRGARSSTSVGRTESGCSSAKSRASDRRTRTSRFGLGSGKFLTTHIS